MSAENSQSPLFGEGEPTSPVDTAAIAAAGGRRIMPKPTVSSAAEDQGWRDPGDILPLPPRQTPEEQFIEKFTWAPYSKGELKPAIAGLSSTIPKAYRGGGLSAVKNTYFAAETHRDSAARNMLILRKAFATPNERDSLDATLTRDNSQIIEALAQHQFFTKALQDKKMPSQQKASALKNKTAELERALYAAEDEELLALWKAAFESASQRELFWRGEINSVADLDWVKQILRDRQIQAASR